MAVLRLMLMLALLVSLLMSSAGCAPVQRWASRDESERRAARMQEVQLKVMRYADDYSGRIKDPLEALKAGSTTPEERLNVQNWRISQSSAAYTIASGTNPVINALDMIVLATLSRMVVEDLRIGAFSGPEAMSLLEVHRDLERQAWALLEGVLDDEQKAQLQTLIAQWRAEHPDAHAVSQVRFANFAAVSRRSSETHGGGGLFAFIGLDPLSNLDPAVRELEQTRQLAERTIYYLQRSPALLDMQVERLSYQLATMPEATQMLHGVERIGIAAETFAELTADVRAIIAEQDRMQSLLVDLRKVLNAGAQTSDSVGATVAALDTLVARLQAPQGQSREPSAPRRPFDITEYAETARELASAARDAQTLLVQLERSGASVESLANRTTHGLRELVDRAFWRGVTLIVVLAIAALLTTLTYRYVTVRWRGQRRRHLARMFASENQQ